MKQFNYKKAMLITAGILTALIIVRAVLFFTAKPKITVDYVAEYNRFSLPENYNPEDNAAELYQKAFDAFIEMPEHLIYSTQPTADEDEQIKNWLASNAQALDCFKQASLRPYYWIEKSSNTSPPEIDTIQLSDIFCMRNFLTAYALDFQYKAEANQLEAALENLLTCYRVGMHKWQPNQLLWDQSLGYSYILAALRSAFDFLDRFPDQTDMLELLEAAFLRFAEEDRSLPSTQVQRFAVLDIIQRTFAHGRWAWQNSLNEPIDLRDLSDWRDNCEKLKQRFHLCIVGPTQKEVLQKLEDLMDLSERLMPLTPWQLNNASIDFKKEMQCIQNFHVVLEWTSAPSTFWEFYHKKTAKTHALITVLAILRFHRHSNRYPQSLQELIETGYLQTLPMDPYSDGPLVYRLTEDGFTLYSVGKDFADNNGMPESDITFSTPSKDVVEIDRPDIVYWPVYRAEDFPAPPVDPNEMRLYEEFLF